MKCLITGAETMNKWNNIPVCKNAIKQAKLFMAEDNITMKMALVKVEKLFNEIVDKRVTETIHEETLNLIK